MTRADTSTSPPAPELRRMELPRTISPTARAARVISAKAAGGIPSFEKFALDWLDRQVVVGGHARGGVAGKTREDLEWRLERHLLPAFGPFPLDQIGVEDIDRYLVTKLREGKLSASSINKTLMTLAAILEVAVEYELIPRNPARGRRRRLRGSQPNRPWLDRSDQIVALLDGAAALDRSARVGRGQRRALLATLTFAGLRIGEALALEWSDIDLARSVLCVRSAKTHAGVRTVDLLPVLHHELTQLSEATPGEGLVFGTTTGGQQSPTNVRKRILARSIDFADANRAREGREPMPKGLTPHSLRRTFASLLFALGEAPPYVMAQMGHRSANLTLSVYAREMLRRDGEPERLRALVGKKLELP